MSIFVKPEIAAQRMQVCKACKFYRDGTKSCGTLMIGENARYYKRVYRLCGCVMPIKTKFHLSSCPVGKWGPEALTEIQAKKAREFLALIETRSKLDSVQVQQLYDWRAKISGTTIQTKFCSDCVRQVIRELQEALKYD